MPRRELKHPRQVEAWLIELSRRVTQPAQMILIGSGGLLWHAFQRGLTEPLPENSMDVDPITDSDEVARLCYEAVIGSEFERDHGWHVNLMPDVVLREFPAGWEARAFTMAYGHLTLKVYQHRPIYWRPSANAMNRATGLTKLGPIACVC